MKFLSILLCLFALLFAVPAAQAQNCANGRCDAPQRTRGTVVHSAPATSSGSCASGSCSTGSSSAGSGARTFQPIRRILGGLLRGRCR